MIIFVIALIFLTEVILLIKLGVVVEKRWRRYEELILADPCRGRVALMYEYADAAAACQKLTVPWLSSPHAARRLCDAKSMLEFHAIRDRFVEDKSMSGLVAGSNFTDWERIRSKVDYGFSFSEYLKNLMHETIERLVELSSLTWCLMWIMFVPLWYVQLYTSQLSATNV